MTSITDFARSSTGARRSRDCLIALALVAAATLLRFALDPLVHDRAPFITYLGAVIFAGWWIGAGGASLVAVVSLLAADYFFVSPRFRLSVDPGGAVEVVVFAVFSFCLVWLVSRWRRVERDLGGMHVEATRRARELQTILDTVPAAVFLTHDGDGSRMEGNRLTAEYLRVAPGSNVSRTAPPSERPGTFRAFKDGREIPGEDLPVQVAIATGREVRDCEFDLVYEDGSWRTLFGNAVPLKDDDGRVRGAVGAFVDVTAAKRALETVRESEQRYGAIFENSPFGVALAARSDGRIVSANRAFLRLYGFTREEVIGRTAVELGIADQPSQDELWRELEESGVVSDREMTRRTKSGETRYVILALIRVTILGEPYALGITEDVTERQLADDALRASEARFRAVLEGSRDVIYRVDLRTGRYQYISSAAESVLGYPADALIGFDVHGLLAMIHPEDAPMVRAAVETALQAGAAEVEYRQRTKSGEYRWVSNYMAVVRDADGRPLYRDGNIRDVTRRKQVDEELRESELRLQEQAEALAHANRVKDEFLATLSHELRTPLNAVLGWSDMLLRPGLTEETQRRALESINRNARAQAALISDILDVSRIITGKLRLDVRPVDLSGIIKAACESIQPAADARGIVVESLVEGRPILAGDPDRLQQILWNLLSNSVKFTDRGGRVSVEVRREGAEIRLVVSDTGRGIRADFLPHVFERFRQADSSTTRMLTGLGLGLAIVRHLVELHGGSVTAESAGEGQGSTFTVVLPVGPIEDVAGSVERAVARRLTRPEAVDHGCLEGLSVVAVDDQPEARILVEAVLKRYGARVTVCSSAEQALAAVQREHPDVLLADIGMPYMDGYELIRQVRALPDPSLRTLPAVALTAYGAAHDRVKALASGYVEHLAKPITADALVAVVAHVVGRAVR